MAIPGLLPPVPYGDDLLVDGGVLNNLPVEPMRNHGMIDTVIAVDVAPRHGPRAKRDFGTWVSGVRALGAMLRPGESPYPKFSSVLLRTMLTGSVHNQRSSMRDDSVDLMLPLSLPGVGLLEFERIRPIAQVGYESSIAAIREWVESVPHLVGR